MPMRPAQRTALVALVVLFALTWIRPRWPLDQALHSSLTVLALAGLAAIARRRALADRDFLLLCGFLALHCLGARWLYSNVPYDQWAQAVSGRTLSSVFGWERNHFDRLVHLAYGLCVTPALAHAAAAYRPMRHRHSAALAVLLVMASSLLYEWAEWLVALGLSPQAAEAYNGQQGDPWDAHADMLLATLGALFWLARRPSGSSVEPAA